MDDKATLIRTQASIGTSGYAPPQYTEKPPIPSDNLLPLTQQPLQQVPAIRKVPKRKDYYDLSLLMIIIWILSCSPHLLCCSVPALYLAHKGRKYYAAGDEAAGEKKMRAALVCNLVAIGVGFTGLIFINFLGPALGVAIPIIVKTVVKKHDD